MLELCGQGSLLQILQSDIPLSIELRLRIAIECARGLSLLHSLGILHRDIKSPNILITHDFHGKLGDFGMAQARTETKTITKSTEATSLRWTAPEMFGIEPHFTAACDVFSFGVLLYELAVRKVTLAHAHLTHHTDSHTSDSVR